MTRCFARRAVAGGVRARVTTLAACTQGRRSEGCSRSEGESKVSEGKSRKKGKDKKKETKGRSEVRERRREKRRERKE